MADVILNNDAWKDAPDQFARAMDRTLRAWAMEIERRAKAKSPVDTGFNKNSIYSVMPDGEMMADNAPVTTRPGHGQGGRVKKYKPGKFAKKSSFDAPEGTIVAEVRVGAEYAIYLEMGTVYMEPRPFLGPATAEVTPQFGTLLTRNLKREGLE